MSQHLDAALKPHFQLPLLKGEQRRHSNYWSILYNFIFRRKAKLKISPHNVIPPKQISVYQAPAKHQGPADNGPNIQPRDRA